jgi:phosphoribosylformimino-5-aminoimidazole carboxamide ribonucleotide (ProFAR) isomerase
MSIDEAITKIKTAVEVINFRGGVRDHEKKRVKEAFAMLAQPPGPLSGKKSGKTSKRREIYLQFLRRVNEQCGSQLVVASSVGIGQSAIAGMKELTRLRLSLEIKKHERALKSPSLQRVTTEFCIEGGDTFSFANMSSI